MDLMIRRDIRQLGFDAQAVREGLEMLVQDHEAWSKQYQQDDLKQLIENLIHLESDMSIIEVDCISRGFQYHRDGKRHVLDYLHNAFANLNILFNGLKKLRTELNKSHIHPAELKQLEIDWGRLRKTIGEIQKFLQVGS